MVRVKVVCFSGSGHGTMKMSRTDPTRNALIVSFDTFSSSIHPRALLSTVHSSTSVTLTPLPSFAATDPRQMPVQHRKADRMTGYNALWDKQAAKETAEHVKSRMENYTELVNGRSCQGPSKTSR